MQRERRMMMSEVEEDDEVKWKMKMRWLGIARTALNSSDKNKMREIAELEKYSYVF